MVPSWIPAFAGMTDHTTRHSRESGNPHSALFLFAHYRTIVVVSSKNSIVVMEGNYYDQDTFKVANSIPNGERLVRFADVLHFFLGVQLHLAAFG